MISQETIRRIEDAAQIVEVVSDFVSLRRSGSNYMACCPFHNEKTPSFSVSPSKGLYKCFGCGKAGGPVRFVMEHENMSYPDALRYLAKKYNIEIVEEEESAEKAAARQRNESLYIANEFAQKFFVSSLQEGEGRAVGYRYFKERGLEDETIRKWNLGWAPSQRNSLVNAATAAGFHEDILEACGLEVRRDDGRIVDKFYDRVMFPIQSISGRVIAFGGRTLKKDKTVPKYVNSPETEIYVKSRSLYGIWFAKGEMSKQDKCYLVEGYLDVLSMHQLGITNVVASSGTSLTVEQVRLIRRFTQNVTIMYDGDSAGIHAAIRGIGLVLKEGLNVRVVLLPDGDDPDSYSRKHSLEEVKDFIATHEQDFIAFKTDLLLSEAGDDPLKRANLINDIADTIALIPDPVKRSVYAKSTSERFGLEDGIILERIAKTRTRLLEEEKREQERERLRDRSASRPQGPRQLSSQRDVPPPTVGDAPSLPPSPSYPGGIPSGMDEYSDEWGNTPVDTQYEEVVEAVREDTKELIPIQNKALAPSENDLLWFILNHGVDTLEFETDSDFFNPEGNPTVADFIREVLEDDGQSFVNDAYRRTYDAFFEIYDSDENATQDDIVRRILDGGDELVSLVAAELVMEKYPITVGAFRVSMTATSTMLAKHVPRTILVYNLARTKERQEELKRRLTTASEEELLPLMQTYKKLIELRKNFELRLGRVR